MNLYSVIWGFIIILSFSIKRFPLLPAGCQRFNGLGYLTVEPAPLFLMGSNLTVYCHIKKCQWRFKIFLELNGKIVDPWKRVNCTTTIFNLSNVQTPQSIMICKMKSDQLSNIVHGMDLRGGLPPDKPESITCETSRSSEIIECSWERGQETHLPTAYNISVNRENGTQILLDQIQDAEKITIPRVKIDENTTYQLIITAYNHFGALQSDPFILCVKDIVNDQGPLPWLLFFTIYCNSRDLFSHYGIMIPDTPHIMQLEFGNNSVAATLRWKTVQSSEHLRPCVRLRTDNGAWEAGAGAETSEGLIQVDGLKPLTEYEFQIKTCDSASGLVHTNTLSVTPRAASSKRWICSKWSPSVRGRTPGKGPSQRLQVWRMLGCKGTNGLQMVTVLWKFPSPEDYSGEVQQYKIFLGNDHKEKVTCHAALSQCSVQVPAEVQALSISAVTLYGTSPPADVPFRDSGDFGPGLRELAAAAIGSGLFVSWSWLGSKHWSPSGGELLHYVLEWTSVPVAELQWQTLAKDQQNTTITGLTAGVRYSISLYAVTTRGVSAPSSGLVYFKEQKPKSSPNMSVVVHEARRILIQWDELPVDQQRGFITNYTIYLQTLDSSRTELSVTVSGSDPRRKWLYCPEGALALQLTASTSAGEGPRGRRISSQPAIPAFGLVIVIVFIITLFIAIIVNLMCWSCVRERIKQGCISWAPAWFDENLPKPGNSMAIKLLEQRDRSDPSYSSNYSDPPLSPISLLSQLERDDVYATIHVEKSQVGSGQAMAETSLLMSDPGAMLIDSKPEHVSYKPQTATLAPHGDEMRETEEAQMAVATSGEEGRCSSVFEGLLGSFLSSVEVDVSDSPLGLPPRSVSSLLWPQTPDLSFLNGGSLSILERRVPEDDVEVDSPCLDLQHIEIMTSDSADTCVSQYTVEATLSDGYFPQVAAVNGQGQWEC